MTHVGFSSSSSPDYWAQEMGTVCLCIERDLTVASWVEVAEGLEIWCHLESQGPASMFLISEPRDQ